MPTRTALTCGRVMASPFLPSLPAVALGDLGRVKFPPRTSEGLITDADRDPRNPDNRQTVYGASTYTRPPDMQRVGGKYPPKMIAPLTPNSL